ncbi:zinc-binding protein A33-like [Ambystoma mexicanum]|uniref:zinc-binding protein A33-like n=1 Tax=Ambystoma mexicanum TaxID=8296 RepID=UPI0037E7BF91
MELFKLPHAAPTKESHVTDPEGLALAALNDQSYYTQELTCSVCLDLFQMPVLLHCGHCFCRACIDSSCDGKVRSLCPICRTEFNRGRYTAIMALANLVERVKGDSPRRSQAGNPKEQCKDHQEKLKLFCKNDGVLACLVCRDALAHANHSFLPVQDAVTMYKDQLSLALNPLRSTMKKLEDLEKDQEKTMRHHKWDTLNTKSSIAFMFEKLHEALKALEVEMLEELHDHEQNAKELMAANLASIKEGRRKIQKTLEVAKNRLKMQDPLEFLKGIKSCLEECSEEPTICAQEVSGCLFQMTSRGPIEYVIWKQLRSSISPAPSCLTLDPETAHGNLLLSEDLTSVQYSSTCWRPLQPKRFSKALAVLASQGFTSGRHYWEVDVGKASAWVLGVTEESISRKEHVDLIPRNGVWMLRLDESGTYKACEAPSRVLAPTTRPQKIGVYLDFEEALLSFYNAEDMCHLHTFGFITNSKLFPYFRCCASRSQGKSEILTICH